MFFTRSKNSPFVYSCVLNSANLILKRLQEMFYVFPQILAYLYLIILHASFWSLVSHSGLFGHFIHICASCDILYCRNL